MKNEVFFYDPYELKIPLSSRDLITMNISIGFGKGEVIWYRGERYIVDRVTIEDNMHFVYLNGTSSTNI